MQKAKYYDGETQENPLDIARRLRLDFSKAPSLHKAITNIVPILEEYALIDKSRASRYRAVAESLRKVAKEIKTLITEYEE
jgi:hypothetical protein